jgi:hypothetical protein
MRRTPDSLIANEPYDVAFTRHLRRAFNARVSSFAPAYVGPDGQPVNPGTVPPPSGTTDTSALAGDSSEFAWLSRGAILAITLNTPAAQPVLLSDNFRNLLIIQNNTISGTGDVAPILSVGIDGPVQSLNTGPGIAGMPLSPFAINLAQGEGLVLDVRMLTNAIYVAWGPATNTSGQLFIAGMVTYGRSPNSPPLPPQALATIAPHVRSVADFGY